MKTGKDQNARHDKESGMLPDPDMESIPVRSEQKYRVEEGNGKPNAKQHDTEKLVLQTEVYPKEISAKTVRHPVHRKQD